MLKRHCYGKSDGAAAAYLKALLNKKHRRDRNKELVLGLRELAALKSEGAEVGPKSYCTVLNRCGKWKANKMALSLLEQMKGDNIRPDEKCWEGVVTSCITTGELEHTLDLLETSEHSITDPMVLQITRLLIKEGSRDDALTVLHTIQPSSRSPVWHALHIAAQHDLKTAGHVFDTLPLPVLSFHYLALLQHCAAEGNYHVAEGVFALMRSDRSIEISRLMWHRLLLSCLYSETTSIDILFKLIERKISEGFCLTESDLTLVIRSAERGITHRASDVLKAVDVGETAFRKMVMTMQVESPAVTSLLKVYVAAATKLGTDSLPFADRARALLGQHGTGNLKMTPPTMDALHELADICGFDPGDLVAHSLRMQDKGAKDAYLIDSFTNVM
eukprot:TRINITY_DN1062_c1_g1_i1.p1 TRINITY_DN1062_c1_g1~~TRINITY_DN1062_c1_g1_i1.p1  ORF type:complete len:388 (+),score=58.71 TRINITY_DN1062_c1_g1_i1:267-1430(+)